MFLKGPQMVFWEVKDLGIRSASRHQKGWWSAQKCDSQAKQWTPLKIEGTQGVITHGVLVLGVAVHKNSPHLSTTPMLKTSKPFSFTRRHALWALLLSKLFLSNPCCLCSANFDGIQLLVSNNPWIPLCCNPLFKWSFLMSHPIFPLWVVQLLLTSPDLLLWSRWLPSSTCTDLERAGSCWDSKDAWRVSTWASP